MTEQQTETSELGMHLPPGLDTIMGFYDAEVVGLVHASNAFTVREHFSRLIQLCQSADNKTSLAALKELRAARREVLELNGFIGVMKAEQVTGDGSRKEIVTHQIARMDSIIKALDDRRSNNGSGTPSPKILEAEDFSGDRGGEDFTRSISETIAAATDDKDADGHQRAVVQHAEGGEDAAGGECIDLPTSLE